MLLKKSMRKAFRGAKFLTMQHNYMESLSTKFYSYASPVVIVEAVALFLVFLNKKSMSKKYIIPINKMARHSFSVYIIHFSMISVLFTKVFKLSSYFDNIRTGMVPINIGGGYCICIS